MHDQIIICRKIIKKQDAGTPGNGCREFHIPQDCGRKSCLGFFIRGKTEPLYDCFKETTLRSIEEAKKVVSLMYQNRGEKMNVMPFGQYFAGAPAKDKSALHFRRAEEAGK